MERLAIAVTVGAALLLVANFGYGLIHECAHAALVEVLGGRLYGLYVNPLGLDAYTEHSPLGGIGYLALELAGLSATTIAALVLAGLGKEVVPAFFALRTAIYALNYSSGTDISNVYAALGDTTFLISLTFLAVNCLVLALALRHHAAVLKDLSSSLWRGRSPHNSGE